MTKLNCWEFKKCGREPGGANAVQFGVCPSAIEDRADGINGGKHGGRACWLIAGTCRAGKIYGTFAEKMDSCVNCDFYQLVLKEEGLDYHSTREITDMMARQFLTIGLPVLLRLSNKEEVWAKVIGWEADSCIITHLPLNKFGKHIEVSKGDKCNMRFVKGDNAFSFDTGVVNFQFNPIPLIFFEYPSLINKTPFRKYKRFMVHIPAKIYFNEGTGIDALIDNVSEGGCSVKVLSEEEIEFEKDKKYKLSFTILDVPFENVEITVKTTKSEENVQLLGVEFPGLSEENKNTIKAFMALLKTDFT